MATEIVEKFPTAHAGFESGPGKLMDNLVIRKALKEDLAAILALYEGLGDILDVPTAERIFERMQRYPNYALYAAVVDAKIIGTFALLIMDNLAHKGTPSGIVEDVVVSSQWRGQGVGKQMMQFAMEQCKQAGCYKLMLSSNLKREAAHRFYESLGFQRHGYSFQVLLGE
jgi:GNAT superfamily N-acetyltransferase